MRKYGRNQIQRRHKISPLKIFLSQFSSPLIILLMAAALVSWLIGFLPRQDSNLVDSLLILLIVFVSGVAGFFQDYKAEKAIEALEKIAAPKSKVIRDGKQRVISVRQIVPGDLVVLDAGDIVPADCRLIEAHNLELNESVLTGESRAIRKKSAEQIYKGTFVDIGRARAEVTKTGMQTKIGKIASSLEHIQEEETPFQQAINKLSRKIIFAVGVAIGVVFVIDLFKYNFYESLLTSVSLAVAAVPEGLPAVLMLTLAMGAKSMLGRKALVRKLNVVESISGIDIICTDKTGTLTKNEMEVVKISFVDNFLTADDLKKGKLADDNLKQLLICGRLCNNVELGVNSLGKQVYLGDQTEVAIRKISDKLLSHSDGKNYQRFDEVPFSSERKMMSVLCQEAGNKKKYSVFSKGAPELLLAKCKYIYRSGKIIRLDEKNKEQILGQNEKMAKQALRVLGLAYKETSNKDVRRAEKDLIWLGLEGMIDPARAEAKQAISECQSAGIRVMMLTGDGAMTALAIAKGVGLASGTVIEGSNLDSLSDKEIWLKIKQGVNIFARISPFHKLKILEILKNNGHKVIMTGDGVNDALALKKADVGIAMGIKGTEVAKQASDIILVDDNFASIRNAVQEGRRAFDNIQKFINYLFVSNFAEIAVIFLAALFITSREPILLPVQLLWINLLTDGLPALALGVDPARPNIMQEPPKKGNSIITKRLAWLIGTIGSKKTLVLLATFFLILPRGMDAARTALFTGFILYEFVRIATIRYQEKLSWLANKWLLAALLFSIVLQLIVVYSPLNVFLHTVPLSFYEWLVLLAGVSIGYISAIGITKLVVKLVKE